LSHPKGPPHSSMTDLQLTNANVRISKRKEWDGAFQKYVAKYMQYLDTNQ
jgi:hypothetical protein